MCLWLERGAHFCKNTKTKCMRAQISSKSHLRNCIFDASSDQDTSIIRFFSPRSATASVFWKSQKPGRRSFWGGRAECAGALGGDLRGVRDLQIWDLQLRTCGVDSTRQRLPYGKGGGFNRSAHSARPSHRQWEMGKWRSKRAMNIRNMKWEIGDRNSEIGNHLTNINHPSNIH